MDALDAADTRHLGPQWHALSAQQQGPFQRQWDNVVGFARRHWDTLRQLLYAPLTHAAPRAATAESAVQVRPSAHVEGALGVFAAPAAVPANCVVAPYPGLLLTHELHDEFNRQFHCPTGVEATQLNYEVDAAQARALRLNLAECAVPGKPGRYLVRMDLIGDPRAVGPLVNSPRGLGEEPSCVLAQPRPDQRNRYLETRGDKIVVRSDYVRVQRRTTALLAPKKTEPVELLMAYELQELRRTQSALDGSFFWERELKQEEYCDRCFSRSSPEENPLLICSQELPHSNPDASALVRTYSSAEGQRRQFCSAARHALCESQEPVDWKSHEWFCDRHRGASATVSSGAAGAAAASGARLPSLEVAQVERRQWHSDPPEYRAFLAEPANRALAHPPWLEVRAAVDISGTGAPCELGLFVKQEPAAVALKKGSRLLLYGQGWCDPSAVQDSRYTRYVSNLRGIAVIDASCTAAMCTRYVPRSAADLELLRDFPGERFAPDPARWSKDDIDRWRAAPKGCLVNSASGRPGKANCQWLRCAEVLQGGIDVLVATCDIQPGQELLVSRYGNGDQRAGFAPTTDKQTALAGPARAAASGLPSGSPRVPPQAAQPGRGPHSVHRPRRPAPPLSGAAAAARAAVAAAADAAADAAFGDPDADSDDDAAASGWPRAGLGRTAAPLRQAEAAFPRHKPSRPREEADSEAQRRPLCPAQSASQLPPIFASLLTRAAHCAAEPSAPQLPQIAARQLAVQADPGSDELRAEALFRAAAEDLPLLLSSGAGWDHGSMEFDPSLAAEPQTQLVVPLDMADQPEMLTRSEPHHHLWLRPQPASPLQSLAAVDLSRTPNSNFRAHGDYTWPVESKQSGAPLHYDLLPGFVTQVRGSKLWVAVHSRDAQAHGLQPQQFSVHLDGEAGTYDWATWLACPSFRWWRVDPGMCVWLPGSWLHATFTLGDEPTLSIGRYCAPPPSLPWQLLHWVRLGEDVAEHGLGPSELQSFAAHAVPRLQRFLSVGPQMAHSSAPSTRRASGSQMARAADFLRQACAKAKAELADENTAAACDRLNLGLMLQALRITQAHTGSEARVSLCERYRLKPASSVPQSTGTGPGAAEPGLAPSEPAAPRALPSFALPPSGAHQRPLAGGGVPQCGAGGSGDWQLDGGGDDDDDWAADVMEAEAELRERQADADYCPPAHSDAESDCDPDADAASDSDYAEQDSGNRKPPQRAGAQGGKRITARRHSSTDSDGEPEPQPRIHLPPLSEAHGAAAPRALPVQPKPSLHLRGQRAKALARALDSGVQVSLTVDGRAALRKVWEDWQRRIDEEARKQNKTFSFHLRAVRAADLANPAKVAAYEAKAAKLESAGFEMWKQLHHCCGSPERVEQTPNPEHVKAKLREELRSAANLLRATLDWRQRRFGFNDRARLKDFVRESIMQSHLPGGSCYFGVLPVCHGCFCALTGKGESTIRSHLLTQEQEQLARLRRPLCTPPEERAHKALEMMRVLRAMAYHEGQFLPTAEGNGGEFQLRVLPYSSQVDCMQALSVAVSRRRGDLLVNAEPFAVKRSTFIRALVLLEQRHKIKLHFRKSRTIAHCGKCEELRNRLLQAWRLRDRDAQDQAQLEWDRHASEFSGQRQLVERHKRESLEHPYLCWTCFIDGMDTTKTALPHYPRPSKDHENGTLVPTRVVGTISHGAPVPVVVFTACDNVQNKGGNAAVTYLSRVLQVQWEAMDPHNVAPVPGELEQGYTIPPMLDPHEQEDMHINEAEHKESAQQASAAPALNDDVAPMEVEEQVSSAPAAAAADSSAPAAAAADSSAPAASSARGGSARRKARFMWPRRWHVTFDNTAGDNKNSAVFNFLAALVAIGVFLEVTVTTLLVGHTHDIVDQMFSCWSRALRKRDVPTLNKLHKLMKDKYATGIYALKRLAARAGIMVPPDAAPPDADEPPDPEDVAEMERAERRARAADGGKPAQISERLLEVAEVLGIAPHIDHIDRTIDADNWCKQKVDAVTQPHCYMMRKEMLMDPKTQRPREAVVMYSRYLANSVEDYKEVAHNQAYAEVEFGPWTTRKLMFWTDEAPMDDPFWRPQQHVKDLDKVEQLIQVHEREANIDAEDAAELRQLLHRMREEFAEQGRECNTCSELMKELRDVGPISRAKASDSSALQEHVAEQQARKRSIQKRLNEHLTQKKHGFLRANNWWLGWVRRVRDYIRPYMRKRGVLKPAVPDPEAPVHVQVHMMKEAKRILERGHAASAAHAADEPTAAPLAAYEEWGRDPLGRSAHPRQLPADRSEPRLLRPAASLSVAQQWRAKRGPPQLGHMVLLRGSQAIAPLNIAVIKDMNSAARRAHAQQPELEPGALGATAEPPPPSALLGPPAPRTRPARKAAPTNLAEASDDDEIDAANSVNSGGAQAAAASDSVAAAAAAPSVGRSGRKRRAPATVESAASSRKRARAQADGSSRRGSQVPSAAGAAPGAAALEAAGSGSALGSGGAQSKSAGPSLSDEAEPLYLIQWWSHILPSDKDASEREESLQFFDDLVTGGGSQSELQKWESAKASFAANEWHQVPSSVLAHYRRKKWCRLQQEDWVPEDALILWDSRKAILTADSVLTRHAFNKAKVDLCVE